MDRTKARMTDDPGNSSQNATIRRTQGLRAAGEVRILGRWKYFERYSEEGRVPVVRTQSAFRLRSMGGNPTSEQRPEGDFGPKNLIADFRSAGPSSLKGPLANSSKPLTIAASCCVESDFCSVGFGQYFSTRVLLSGFIRASGNSERCNMTGNEDNVGFLTTGSGVQQFQLSLRGCFVFQWRRFSAQLKLSKHTSNLRLRLLSSSNRAHFGPQDTPLRVDRLSVERRN
jgi:hypothetical protein